jgi:hypothetical protein
MPAPSFREQLVELRQSLAPYAGRGAGAFYPLMIRPALGFALVPRPQDRAGGEDSQRDPAARRREALDRALRAAQPQALGLGEGSNLDAKPSDRFHRKGWNGLTARGAKTVEDFCRLVRQDKGCYGIWTVTLPVEVCAALEATPDGLHKVGDALRRRFAEALTRACERESKKLRQPVPAHWCYVVETQKSGRPHWHFVFRCKGRRRRSWLLGKGKLDCLIRNAFRVATGKRFSVKASGNVQALRADPGRYLSSYLKKTASQNAAATLFANGFSANLIPAHWWGMSRSALRFVQDHRFEVPSLLVGWLSKQWPLLAAMGRLEARLWQPDADGAPAMVVGSWRSPADARECLQHLARLADRASPTGVVFGWT